MYKDVKWNLLEYSLAFFTRLSQFKTLLTTYNSIHNVLIDKNKTFETFEGNSIYTPSGQSWRTNQLFCPYGNFCTLNLVLVIEAICSWLSIFFCGFPSTIYKRLFPICAEKTDMLYVQNEDTAYVRFDRPAMTSKDHVVRICAKIPNGCCPFKIQSEFFNFTCKLTCFYSEFLFAISKHFYLEVELLFLVL